MKQLHKLLKVFIWLQLGACCGRVLQRYLDFIQHPEIYAYYSAPRYTAILPQVYKVEKLSLITTEE